MLLTRGYHVQTTLDTSFLSGLPTLAQQWQLLRRHHQHVKHVLHDCSCTASNMLHILMAPPAGCQRAAKTRHHTPGTEALATTIASPL